MFPGFAINYTVNCTPMYSIASGDQSRVFSTLNSLDNFRYLPILKLGRVLRFANAPSAFLLSVAVVNQRITSKQMAWIYARRIVAFVANIFRQIAISDIERKLVSRIAFHGFLDVQKLPVSAAFQACLPLPAIAVRALTGTFINFRPKTFDGIIIRRSAFWRAKTSILLPVWKGKYLATVFAFFSIWKVIAFAATIKSKAFIVRILAKSNFFSAPEAKRCDFIRIRDTFLNRHVENHPFDMECGLHCSRLCSPHGFYHR